MGGNTFLQITKINLTLIRFDSANERFWCVCIRLALQTLQYRHCLISSACPHGSTSAKYWATLCPHFQRRSKHFRQTTLLASLVRNCPTRKPHLFPMKKCRAMGTRKFAPYVSCPKAKIVLRADFLHLIFTKTEAPSNAKELCVSTLNDQLVRSST